MPHMEKSDAFERRLDPIMRGLKVGVFLGIVTRFEIDFVPRDTDSGLDPSATVQWSWEMEEPVAQRVAP